VATRARPEDGFLERIPAEDAAELRSRAATRSFRAGQALMHELQLGEELMIVLSGVLKVTSTTAEGKEVVLGFRGPGELVGEMAALDEAPRSGSVVAMEPGEALVLAAGQFRALVERRPGLAFELLRTVIRRFRDSDLMRVEFAAAPTLARVAARLLELAQDYGTPSPEGIVIGLRISQEELAGWTGGSREAVAKALHSLRGLGLVATDRRRITVTDMEGLRRSAP
jgi:CRP/FNR family transcriptional regulator, cyclic AMP receptor protein